MFEGVAQQIDPVITAAAALITLLTLLILGASLALSRGEATTAV
jgi:ABC-type spermidine/putrescine transport system permease subunit II